MSLRDIREWTKAKRTWQRKVDQVKTFTRIKIYEILSQIHHALVTDAGLLIVGFLPYLFGLLGHQSLPEGVLFLGFLTAYVACDLIHLPFLRGVTISLGFPVVFLAVLAMSPFAALLVATLGSLVSEVLWSKVFSKQHLPWFLTLRRAFFYAGHHAVAGLGALIACELIRCHFTPWLLNIYGIHIQATLTYIILYSLVSMLLIWPHDRQIRLFLAPDEKPFVRVDFFTTLMLLPLPASLFCLYHMELEQTQKILIVVGVFPPLFLLLFFLARIFARIEEERMKYQLQDEVSQFLGSPANMAEMVERMLKIMGRLVRYHWGAVYSLFDGELSLCGVKPYRESVIVKEPCKDRGTALGKVTQTDTKQAAWPSLITLDEGTLAKLVKGSPPSQFFHGGLAPIVPSDPYLPEKTSIIAFPIMVESQGGGEEESPRLIGLIALARPKRRFTIQDWDKGQALSSKAGNVLLGVQRLESKIRELYRKVEDYAEDPERVRQAMQELVHQQVDVSKILAVVSEHAFQGNVRAVLRDVIAGHPTDEITLDPQTLTEIYDQVRDETPGMPPLDSNLLQLLQTVTSSLSLAFSFRYQFPNVERGSAFTEFYKFLLVALDANIISRIVELDSHIISTAETIQRRTGDTTGSSPLPAEVIEEVEELSDIVHLLKNCIQAEDIITRRASLEQALERLMERERSVRGRLRDPERFVFLQILSGWRVAITNALEDLGRGPAQLNVSLRSRRALPLDEITVGLALRNNGPGVASRVSIQLQPSSDYEVLEGRVDLGTLTAGKTKEPEFIVRSKGEGPLRLQFRITYHDPERKSRIEEFADRLYLLEPPPCFMDIPNPYTVGLPLKPGNSTFVGREDIFNFIRQNIPALMQKTILVLVGERRTGKTSILQQLPTRLNDPRYIPVFVDGQVLGIDPGMGNFLLSLAEAIADGLEKIGIPIMSLTLAELGESPRHVFDRRFLPMVRERIGDRILLLTVDEFEELGDRVKRDLLPVEIFPYLRHLIQHEPQLAFIVAGTHKVEALMGQYWSVLFNIAKYKKVGFLKREETIRLITEPVRSHGMMYDDLAIDEILHLTACHPYFTQLLCNILVNHCNETRCNYVTVQDVRDALQELLETGRAHLTFLWQTSDREAMLILAALAALREQLDQVTAAAISERLGTYRIHLDPGQVMKTMEELVARDIAREITGNLVSYDFTAQLYAYWIRRYQPLTKVVEEVSVEPAK